MLLFSVFHFSVERHVSESPRIYKLNTDIYVVTCYICLCECVVNDCINHARGSAVGTAIDGQPPKVGPVYRVVSTKGASRTSVCKNGRYECPVRMKEHKSIDRLFIASVCKNHRTFRRCYGFKYTEFN
jgi:hypothetical protein